MFGERRSDPLSVERKPGMFCESSPSSLFAITRKEVVVNGHFAEVGVDMQLAACV